jgi:DNA-binding IclR family transcriptional regulator
MEPPDINYKAIDTQRIIDYIGKYSDDGVSVEDIFRHAGADKMRVYTVLFELEQAKHIEVLERKELGAPKVVRKQRIETR